MPSTLKPPSRRTIATAVSPSPVVVVALSDPGAPERLELMMSSPLSRFRPARPVRLLPSRRASQLRPWSAARVVDAMLAYVPARVLERTDIPRRPLFNAWRPKSFRMRLSVSEDATAWFFGVFFDHMIRAEQAWAAPFELASRLGHLDVRRIALMPQAELAAALAGDGRRKALHRLHPRLARNLHAASRRLVDEYAGDVEAIFPDGLHVRELQARLERFSGLGQKLVHMAMNMLVQDYGRRFRGWREVDVAVDRHVARVFMRTGLVTPRSGSTFPSVGELRDDVIATARRLLPMYPAALDYPAYEVGRQWCRAGAPSCSSCPLRAACPKDRASWELT